MYLYTFQGWCVIITHSALHVICHQSTIYFKLLWYANFLQKAKHLRKPLLRNEANECIQHTRHGKLFWNNEFLKTNQNLKSCCFVQPLPNLNALHVWGWKTIVYQLCENNWVRELHVYANCLKYSKYCFRLSEKFPVKHMYIYIIASCTSVRLYNQDFCPSDQSSLKEWYVSDCCNFVN